MSIPRARFDLALERIRAGDWEQFEHLASAFLTEDYPKLRTMASASGDGGRDSVLFSEEDDQTVAFQYSVTDDWTTKIRKTTVRLETEFPKINTLIYVTNQAVGAKADGLRARYRKKGWFLDIFDRSWFLDRADTTSGREAAADALAVKFVDPLLSTRQIDEELVTTQTSEDSRTALLFIEMQIQDSSRAYGLTKSSYDALTLAALRDTDTANRLSRDAIVDKVQTFLPSHPLGQVKARVNSALIRLKNAVRHRKDNDEFHLLDEERVRVSGSMARIKKLKDDLDCDIMAALAKIADVDVTDEALMLRSCRLALETYFLRKGEDFARSAIVSKVHPLDQTTVRSVIVSLSSKSFGITAKNTNQVIADVLETILMNPASGTAAYLSMLLESYTLFAFLAATPDVQRATQKMFGSGEIWIDTSVLLPLLAEAAAPPSYRPFTEMFKQAKLAGLKLYVSEGVLEEVERHVNLCNTFVRASSWTGITPYLISAFIMYGGSKAKFGSWSEQFLGSSEPIQDLADYVKASHKILVESASTHPNVSPELADAVRDAWQTVHSNRRENSDGLSMQAFRLAAHDTESYLHVLSSRIGQKGRAPLGYSDWWLTLDRSARNIMDMIPDNLRPQVNVGPVMSLDYLVRYLAFGPNRDKVDLTGGALSKIYADVLLEPVPADLLDLVASIRAENEGLTENIVQRRIRDKLNAERSRSGDMDSAGMGALSDVVNNAY